MTSGHQGIADPWSSTVRWLLTTFGVVLLICLLLPWMYVDGAKFAWDLADDGSPFRNFAVAIAVTGVAAIVVGQVRLDTVVRGWVAIVLGLGPLVWAVSRASGAHELRVRPLVIIVSLVILAAGHLLRGQRRTSMTARVACTLAFAALVIAYVTPDHGKMYLSRLLDNFDAAEGKFKLIAMIDLAPLIVGATGLLAWRAPSAGRGATDLAWLAIVVLPMGTVLNVMLIMTEERFGEIFRQKIFLLMQLPVITVAWMSFAAYGLAIIAADFERRSDAA